MRYLLSVIVGLFTIVSLNANAHAGQIVDVFNGFEFEFESDGKLFVEGPGGGASVDIDEFFEPVEGIEVDGKIFIDKGFDSIAPIDIIFTVENSGESELYLVFEIVSNLSQQTWNDYHLELGYGGFFDAEDEIIPFIPSPIDDGLFFVSLSELPEEGLLPGVGPLTDILVEFSADFFDNETSEPIFDTIAFMPDAIWMDNGFFPPNGDIGVLMYLFDVPDANPGIPGEFAGDGEYLFTLRQYPTVGNGNGVIIPEPSSLLMMGLGLFGMLGIRFTRK